MYHHNNGFLTKKKNVHLIYSKLKWTKRIVVTIFWFRSVPYIYY